MNSHSKIESSNLAQMLSDLKQEITEITNNIKETDNKVNYYMNKNIENSKKLRHNSASANISKNMILLPKKKYTFSNRSGSSLNLINSKYSKSTNYIRNPPQKDRIVTEYISNLNMNNNINYNNKTGSGLTYNLYSQKNKYNDNLNKLTIQINNNYPFHRLNCLSSYYDRKKLCNNYVYDIRPKYHTCENFYKKKKKRKPCTYIYKSSNIKCNTNNNIDFDNSNKMTEKSSINLNQDFINDSLKKILKCSSHKNNFTSMNMNKYILKNELKKKTKNNCKKYSIEIDEKYNITIPNRKVNNANEKNLTLNKFKNEYEDTKCDKTDITTNNYYYNDIIKEKNLLQIDLKLKDEKIYNLNKEIQRLKNSINIKNSIINILKCGNSNNNININNENINALNDLYQNNNNIPSKNVSNITLNNNIKTLQNEISKLRYNLNLQKNDDYLNLQTKNKDLINENLSLKEQLKNMIDIYYNTEKAKMENEINSRDKKIQMLMNDIANYDKNKKLLQDEIKRINEELENKKYNNENNNEINKYIDINIKILLMN